jgi:hypothetical protein
MKKIFGHSRTSSNISMFPSMPILGNGSRKSRMISELSEVDCSMRALM